MGSFEWMELQTLTSDIAAARSRLIAARSSKDHRLIRVLEQEITAAEERRAQLVANITTDLAATPEHVPLPIAVEDAVAAGASAVIGESSPGEARGDRHRPELPDRIAASGAPSPVAAPNDGSAEGDIIVWDQLTPGDLERAKGELGERRAEMLARHAAELAGLDAERSELETLEQAIVAFLRKFNPSAAAGAVVRLGEERELRLHGRG